MKKVFGKVACFCLFSCCLSLAARADFLYWMVDNPTDTSDQAVGFDYATIRSTASDDSYLTMAGSATPGQTEFYNLNGTGTSGTTGQAYADLSGTDPSDGYVIELWTGNGTDPTKVAMLQLNGEAIRQNIYSDMQPGGFNGDPLTASSGFTPVPEPTSGLLLLIGFAGLALKRGRKSCR